MSFASWLRRDRLLPRVAFAARMFSRGSAQATRWWPPLLALAAAAAYAVSWALPILLQGVGVALVALAGAALVFGWVSRERLGVWLAYGVVLVAGWGGWFFLWLFLEQPWARLGSLVVLAAVSWWYFDTWRRRQQALRLGAEPLLVSPALVVGFLASFGLAAGAESLLVFLNTPLWKLLLLAYLPTLACFVALMVVGGWSLVRGLRALAMAAVVLFQVFVLVTWWPTSAYVAGFCFAATFATLALLARQEAQGFINRRGLARELATVGVLVAVALVTARWF